MRGIIPCVKRERQHHEGENVPHENRPDEGDRLDEIQEELERMPIPDQVAKARKCFEEALFNIIEGIALMRSLGNAGMAGVLKPEEETLFFAAHEDMKRVKAIVTDMQC
jgi:hypothetical protein